MTGYEFSHLRKEDIADVVEVMRASKGKTSFDRAPTQDELEAWTFQDSDFRPEGSWLVRSSDGVVAYALVLVEANRLSAGFDDAYMEFEVVPGERGKGLEHRLVRLATDYILSRGVGGVRARSLATESWRVEALKSEGFAEESRVFFLSQKTPDAIEDIPAPEGVSLVRRPYRECADDEMTRIVEAFNDTFKDHHNFAPEKPERFIQYRDASEDPECFSLAMVGGEIVGVCLSNEDRTFNLERGTRWGWINILGVRQAHRRKGIGTFLLNDGLKWIKERGMEKMFIGVYAKNEKALGMYLSAGFAKETESVWFEKRLR